MQYGNRSLLIEVNPTQIQFEWLVNQPPIASNAIATRLLTSAFLL